MFEVNELTRLDLEGLRDRPTGELTHLYAELDALEARVRYRRLFVLALLDERGVADADGATDTEAWVAASSRLHPRHARAEVAVARRLGEQPEIAAVAAEGRLSWDQLDPLLAVATPDTDRRWAKDAPGTAPGHLAHRARLRRAVTRADAERRHRERSLWWRWDTDAGMLRLRGSLPDVAGATVVKALEREMETTGRNPAGEWDPRDQRAADALVTLVSARVAADADPDRALVMVVAPAAALTAVRDDIPGGELPDAELALAIETVRRLTCDGTTQLLLESPDGTPVGLGRKTRTVPPWMHRALKRRDRCCRFPGCHRTRGLHAHHRRPWAHRGRTDLDNLLLLCTHHHHLVHEGDWTVTGDPTRPDGLTFTSPHGRDPTGTRPPPPPPPHHPEGVQRAA